MTTTVSPVKPVVLLAFANDRGPDGRYLPHLPDEIRQLQKLWEPVDRAARCELILRTNATLDDLLNAFQDHRNRIALFHFGGHGGDYELLLERSGAAPAVADAGGLAAFLAGQDGLQLVFLNVCSTQAQAAALHAAGVPVVIATSKAIDDRVAVEFSTWFHRALVSGASIRRAFEEAAAAIKTAHGGNPRHLYPAGAPQAAPHTDWPWAIYVQEGAATAEDWVLPAAPELSFVRGAGLGSGAVGDDLNQLHRGAYVAREQRPVPPHWIERPALVAQAASALIGGAVVALRGMRGAGKTTLAARHRNGAGATLRRRLFLDRPGSRRYR